MALQKFVSGTNATLSHSKVGSQQMMAEVEKDQVQTDQAEDKLNCSVKLEDSGPWQKKISIVIPREEIDAELDSQYGELALGAEVPGFRKGRAPRGLIQKRFGKDVTDQAKLRLLARAFEQVDEEHDFEILGEPDFDPNAIEMPESGDMTFEYEMEVKPQFELPELEGIRIEKPIFEVNDEKIDESLAELCKRYGHLEDISDQAAQEDDIVRSDITIKVEGVEEEEKLEDHPLRVAEGGVKGLWMEDLAKVLKGVKVGESRSCKTKAPDTHANEAWQDKEAEITIEVKAVRRHKPAELNQEFFDKLGIDGEAQLREFISDDLERQSDGKIRQIMSQQVTDYLNSKIDFELPKKVTARYKDRALQRRFHELMNAGVAQDQIAENLEQLQASSGEQAAKELKMTFIMESVAEKLELTVTEGEINGWIAQMAAQYKRRPEKLRDQLRAEGRLAMMESQLLQEKALDRILETAQIVDAPLPTDKPKEAPKVKKENVTQKTAKKGDEKADNNSDETEKEASSTKPAKKKVSRKPPAEE